MCREGSGAPAMSQGWTREKGEEVRADWTTQTGLEQLLGMGGVTLFPDIIFKNLEVEPPKVPTKAHAEGKCLKSVSTRRCTNKYKVVHLHTHDTLFKEKEGCEPSEIARSSPVTDGSLGTLSLRDVCPQSLVKPQQHQEGHGGEKPGSSWKTQCLCHQDAPSSAGPGPDARSLSVNPHG